MAFVVNPALYKNVPYKYDADFEPIALPLKGFSAQNEFPATKRVSAFLRNVALNEISLRYLQFVCSHCTQLGAAPQNEHNRGCTRSCARSDLLRLLLSRLYVVV
jgi:hypothetical protein